MNHQLQTLLAEMLDLPLDQVTPEMRRVDTEAWDSLNHLRLITAIESEFATSFSMEEIASLQTPADLQRIIESGRRSASNA
jgi:acyl carrier protein